MKNRVRKIILLTGLICIMGFTVCACGGKEETSDAIEEQENVGETIPEGDTEDKSFSSDVGESENSEENDSADGAQDDTTPLGSSSDAWIDSTPNLEGDIKELKDGQFTVIEAILEKSDDGGDSMVMPSDGDDSGFNKVIVTYDENTQFYIQTIYDGGERSEVEKATASELAAGQLVEVWGSSSDDKLKAIQICIVKIV